MAGATPVKKQSAAATERRGIWLYETGMLSFGCGVEKEILITDKEYADLAKMPAAERVAGLTAMRKPAEPEKPAEVAVETPTEENKPVDATP